MAKPKDETPAQKRARLRRERAAARAVARTENELSGKGRKYKCGKCSMKFGAQDLLDVHQTMTGH